MSDLFDIVNLISTVGVDAVKIKAEPGLPEKSSNEILTELFSTFDVPDDDDDDEDDAEASSCSDEAKKTEKKDDEEESKEDVKLPADVKVKVEKEDGEKSGSKKKKKKKHKHKSETKDGEKKRKHKKKSRHNSSESASDLENSGSKKKKKKKKSKRKRDADPKDSDANEPKAKVKKLNNTDKEKSKSDTSIKEKSKSENSEIIKVKKEKEDPVDESKVVKAKEGTPDLPPISKRLDDDAEALEVPKLLEKSKNPPGCKILIKDLKNSEVYNNAVKEVENKKKEKEERLEDGEITDSDEDEAQADTNRTPTLSPTPPPGHSSMRSDRKKYSHSPSSSKHLTNKNDLRLVLKKKEKKKQTDGGRSHSKNNHKRSTKSKDRIDNRSHSSHSRGRRTRSRSADKDRRRGRSRERHDRRGRGRTSRETNHKSRSEDRNRSKWRGRSRSKERKERIEIDKKKLLEIARRNAINMIMKGKLPLAQQDKVIAAIQAGGKTIDELTDFCKNLSRSEAMGELSSISSGDESDTGKGFHHPFLLKERPNSIIMNIRDSKQLPTKTLLEKTTDAQNQLRIQYPVSSGQQHRKNENEWIPVPPKPKNPKPEPKKLFIPAKEVLKATPLPLVIPSVQSQQAVQSMLATQPILPTQPAMLPNQPIPPAQPILPVQPIMPVEPAAYEPPPPGDTDYQETQAMPAPLMSIPAIPVPATPVPPMLTNHQQRQQQQQQQQSIFPAIPSEPIDISAIVSQRLSAMRKLSENPHDVQALSEMYKAQTGMKSWVESKQVPGQFIGSTRAKVLSQAELNSGHQAWARKDQLLTAQPVSGGMGMALLQKMGWKPGEGLGKNKEGTLEPLQLEVKLDKKGLVSDQDINAHKFGKVPKSHVPTIKSLEGKHPVSLLGEYCSKRKFDAPTYELCFECGPDHKKNFLFKVRVNGVEYKPSVASPNKKLAKAEAAQVCLQTIGILPS